MHLNVVVIDLKNWSTELSLLLNATLHCFLDVDNLLQTILVA